MTGGACLAEIWIYPVKALDGQQVEQARITAGGSLEFDRRWALADESGTFVNGKRSRTIQEIRSRFDLAARTIRLERGASSFDGPLVLCEPWLSTELGVPVKLTENSETGFPDDTESAGPTIISRATLAETGSWFGLSSTEMRARLRPNLVLDGLPAFGEDELFTGLEERVRFQIGGVEIQGVNPCQRCVVPSRDPSTGEERAGFQKLFATRRAATLPEWVNRSRFTHYYRVSVNTMVASSEAGKLLRQGDRVNR